MGAAFLRSGFRAVAGVLLLLAVRVPALGQGCTTEIYLYIEKSASASTRETARELLELIPGSVPGPFVLTALSFAGDVSTSNMVRRLPPVAPGYSDEVLHELAVGGPSDATTDLLKLFEHVNITARAAAGPPVNPFRRLFFILGDFAHSPLSEQWLEQGARLTSELRQIVVMNRNVSLVAIQIPPAGPVATAVHREVTRELGSNFLFFDDWASSRREVLGLLSDQTTPLGVHLAINPGAGNPVLQIANHSCTDLPVVTYSVRGDNIAPAVLGALPPPGLRAGDATAAIRVNLDDLGPLTANPAGECVNLWIEAVGQGGVPRRGVAPQPITLGNCAEITEAIVDLRTKLGKSEEMRPCEHLPLPPGNDKFVACFRVRGRLEVPQARLRLEALDQRGGQPVLLSDRVIPADGFNRFRLISAPPMSPPTLAFDGALRYRLYPFDLPGNFFTHRWAKRRLCLGGREDEPKRLRLTVSWGATNQESASALLIRRYPTKGELIPHNPWESAILPLLGLLLAAIILAARLRPANVGRLSHVLLALAAGLLVLGLATHFASSFGLLVEEGFARLLEELSTAGVFLVIVLYLVIFGMGFFDRQPSSRESLKEVQERRYPARRSGRRWATVIVVCVLLGLFLLTTGLIWFLQRDLEECRFIYTAVQEP